MPESKIPHRWMTLKQSAAYVCMSYTKAKKEWPAWKRDFGVTAHRMGKKLLFDVRELDAVIEAHAVN